MQSHDVFEEEVSGADALDLASVRPAPAKRAWRRAWPPLLAIAIALGVWELFAVLKVWPSYVFPGPGPVLSRLGSDLGDGRLPKAILVTMRRALLGYGLSVVIGSALGVLVSRVRVIRSATGALITGLQTMPSIAWFPFAILLFGLSESAILFVVVLGATPAITNGLLNGIDHIPPLLLRAGRVMGARGARLYRHVVLPAALPGYLAGLKQGWAFAWRSLMAGELLVVIANRPSLGATLQFSREFSDAEDLLAVMIVILAIGIIVDVLVFRGLERAILRRRGLATADE